MTVDEGSFGRAARMATSLALVLLGGLPPGAHAQRVDLDARGFGAIPIARFAGAELEAGIGFGATAALRVGDRTFVYAGWDWLRLGAAESFAGAERTFEESGYTAGVRVEYAAGDGVRYRLEGGPTLKRVAVRTEEGDLVVDSGGEWGVEAAGGLILPVSERWKLTPSGRLRWLPAGFSFGGERIDGTLRYAALDFGLSYIF